MKKVLSLMLISTLSLSLVACNKNDKINIDETEVDIEGEMPEVQIIAKDASHKIEVETEEEVSKESKESKQVEVASSQDEELDTFLSTGMQNKISPKRTLSNDEKNEILKQIGDFKVTNKESLNNLVKLIDENIASFDLRERDLMIKKYILSLYDLMNNLNSVLSVIGYDLEQVVNDYDIKVNDKTSIETIPNEYGTVKGFLLEVKDKGFFINSLNKNKDFYLDLDLGNVLTKYKEYISSSMDSYISFNNYEMNNTSLLLDSSNNYNLDEIINRIKMLTDGLELDKQNNYIMVDKYLSSLTYYYQLLLGLSHNQFVDVSTNEFNSSILEKYTTLQEENKDTIIGDILEKTILSINTNNMIYDNDLKSMINDYVNSLIYTDEIKNVINTDINSKYALLNNEENTIEETTETN